MTLFTSILVLTILNPIKTWTMCCLDTLTATSPEYRNIVRQGEQCIHSSLPLITDKIDTFSGNRHNYESLSTYFWPSSTDTPTAPWVYRDGQKNPIRLKYDGDKINKFASRMLSLAKAYYLTNDSRFLHSWTEGIKAWCVETRTKMNPNFKYAQIVVNHNNNQGNYYGIIDGYVLIDVIESIRIMQYEEKVPPQLDKKLRKWFGQLSDWLMTSPLGIQQDHAPNNLSLAYDVMLYAFLTYTQQTEKAVTLVNNLPSRRIANQFKEDGSQPQELKRATPIAYSLYNLEHLLDFCLIAQTQGNESLYPDVVRPVAQVALNYIQTLILNLPYTSSPETKNLPALKNTYRRLQEKQNYLEHFGSHQSLCKPHTIFPSHNL